MKIWYVAEVVDYEPDVSISYWVKEDKAQKQRLKLIKKHKKDWYTYIEDKKERKAYLKENKYSIEDRFICVPIEVYE